MGIGQHDATRRGEGMEVVGTAGAGAGGGDTSPEGRLAALVALGDRLARAHLDEREIVQATARSISETLECAAVVFLVRDDLLVPEGVHHRTEEGSVLIRSIFDSVPHPLEGGLLGPVVASGEALVVPVVPDELLRSAYPRPEHAEYFDRFGVSSLVLSPMRSGDVVMGVVAAAAEHGREPFTQTDVLAATDLCQRVTMALDNARLHADAAAAASRLQAIVDASTDAVVTIDRSGRVLSANAATEVIFGWPPQELVGRSIEVVMPPATAEEHQGHLDRYLSGGEPHVIGRRRILEAQRRDGSRFWAELSVAEIDDGTTSAFTGFVRDVSDRVEHHAELSRLADVDALTGALNRRAMSMQLTRLFESAIRSGDSVVIAFADLDGFKSVNDRLGHAAGDAILRIAADRIRANIRTDDLLGRWGGDELLVAGVRRRDRAAEGSDLAQRIRTAVFGPVRLADTEADVTLSASVGWSTFPDDSDDVDALVRLADAAMFEDKRRGPAER